MRPSTEICTPSRAAYERRHDGSRRPPTSKPYVLFYTTKRVGGNINNFEACKLLKFGTS
jgi:HK97 family phage major capsid protein